tara:strand:- start:188 stop:394 length:207 start_codon:yes stop_codon:yes gene_type:complete
VKVVLKILDLQVWGIMEVILHLHLIALLILLVVEEVVVVMVLMLVEQMFLASVHFPLVDLGEVRLVHL